MSLLSDIVHIFLVNDDTVVRPISVENTYNVIDSIFKSLDVEYHIHNCSFKTGIEWDNYLIDTIKTKDFTIYNSKEDYENVIVKNSYINCIVKDNVSATNIEKNLYDINNFNCIVKEYQKYLTKVIYLNTNKYEKIITPLNLMFDDNRFIFKLGSNDNDLTINDNFDNIHEYYLHIIKAITKEFKI